MATGEFRTGMIRGDDDALARDLLASFSQALIQTLLKLGLYDPNHPSARESLVAMYQSFVAAIRGHHEVTFIAIRSEERPEVLVEGYFKAPTALSEVMRSGTAEVFVPKFLDYFIRHRMFSLTLNNRLAAEEMQGFVTTMFQSLRPDVSAEQVRGALLAAGVRNITLLFNEDAVGVDRRLTWQTELALSRMSKDLAKLSLMGGLDANARAQARVQFIGEIVRPLHSAEAIAELLVNFDLVYAEVMRQGVSDPLRTIISHVAPGARYDVIRNLAQTQARIASEGKPRSRERPDLDNAAAVVSRVIAAEILKADRREDDQILPELLKAKLITAEQMPARFKEAISLRIQATAMIERSAEYLTWLREESNPDMFSAGLAVYPDLVPELSRPEGRPFLIDALSTLGARRFSPAEPQDLRDEIARVADAMARRNVVALLREWYGEAKKEDRARFKDAFRLFGSQGVQVYLDILRTSEDRWVRKSCLEALCAMGPEIENALLSDLTKPKSPWYVVRNILFVIERVGTPAIASAIEAFLSHSDTRVRAAAIGAFARARGAAAEAKLGRMLDDTAPQVLEALVEKLGGLQSRHPQLCDLYRNVLDPAKESAYAENLRRAACTAIARTGNIQLKKDLDAETLLCTALKGAERKVLGLSVSRKPAFSPTVRSMICDALAAIGAAPARAALEEVLKRNDPDAPNARRALEAMNARGGQNG